MALEVYDNSTVESHEKSDSFKTTLASVSVRDYQQDFGLPNEVMALDIDAWEVSLSGDNDKTMDAAIGVADYIDNTKRASRLLLVELRMNYTGQGLNSKTSDMKAKSQHTRNMLNGSPVDTRSFFIFQKNVAPSVRNRISRESVVDKTLQNWRVVSPEEFVSMFQFFENLPYKPLSPIDDIRNCGVECVAVADFDNALKLVKYWLDKVNAFYNQYKIEECKALVEVIQEVINAISAHQAEITDEESQIDILIAQEDLTRYRNVLNM